MKVIDISIRVEDTEQARVWHVTALIGWLQITTRLNAHMIVDAMRVLTSGGIINLSADIFCPPLPKGKGKYIENIADVLRVRDIDD